MRRIAFALLGLALVGAASSCSSDAPSPTPPKTITPGSSGSSALQIRLFTSNANPVAGTCTTIQALVTLNGANVPDGTGVSFSTDLASSFFQQNGLPLISVVTQGGTTTTALCSSSVGLATVRANATVGSNTATATIAIAFQASPNSAPFFTFCSPSFGPAAGGTSLTINGGRFFGDPSTTRATFTAAGVTREALVTAVTATSVTLVTPAFPEATSSSVPVNITLIFGTKTANPVTLSLPNCFAFGTAGSSTPTITAILPSSGTNEGNTRVTIIGSGFSAPLQVFFGPVEAQVQSISFNQIVVLTPPASGAGLPNLNASVTVRVHEINSGVDASLADGFRFVTALQITAISNNLQRVDQPFATVTISGQGFLAPVAVTLAGVAAKPISVSATELVVLPGTPILTGCTDVTGPVTVTNIDSGDSKSALSFTYLVAATKANITSVTPSAAAPGTNVTINGTNLGNVTNVTIGGRPAPIVSVSPTAIVVTVPDNGATAPACPAGTPAGTLLNVGSAVDVVATSSLTTCAGTLTAGFQFQLPCKPGADLAITKNSSPNPVVTGTGLTYSLSISNNGPNTANAVVVSDPLPGGVSFLNCTTSQGTCSFNNGTVTANLGDLASPGFASVTINVTVTAPGGSTITNTAVVSSTTPDTNLTNNTATTTTTVSVVPPPPTLPPTTPTTPLPTPTPTPGATADLALTKTASPGTVVSGSTLTYQLGVTNNSSGSGTAFGVVLTDPLPVGTTFQSCTTSQGSCTGPAVGANGTVTANLVAIPSPGFALVTIVVTVTAPGGSTFTNTAVVSATTPDSNLGNNTASVSTTVTSTPGGADLSVVKTAPATVTSGANMTYTVKVHNGGPDPAAAVIITDAIPSGTTFVSCTSALGTCSGPAVGSNGTVTANVVTLAVNATETVLITVNVTASSGSTLTNTAVASSSTTDPNPANNFSTATTNVNGVTPTPATPTLTPTVTPTPVFADLALTKTGSPNPVFTGKTLTYTIVVNNNGPNPAATVEMSDPLPSQTTLASAPTTTAGSCTAPAIGTNGTVRCELGAMAPSGSATITIVVTVNAAGGSSVTNTATVTSDTADPNLSNNSQTITTSVSS